ncbi:MAG TPA: YihY/virulence factor BrkB family protein [Gaiellaceae bacterium]|nr:YihY/virulence factor BrkB family protein [Gaiellaceae bacterium]
MSDPAAEAPGRVARLVQAPLEHLGGVVRGVARALPRAVEDMFTDRCTQYAAAIAYRVLFSLFPLTIALVSIFGLVLQDDELRQQVIDELVDFLPVSESGQGNIQTSIEQIATPLSAIGLISLVALLWGASGMMASIRLGLETAMKVDRGRPAARAKLVDFILVAAAGVLVILIVGLSAFGAFFSKLVDRFTEWANIASPSGILVRDGIQLVAIAITVLLLYRFVPARKIRRRGALAGAILTAVGVWGSTKVLAIVFSDFSRYNLIYGSLAGVMTFLFFVYVVAWILLLGAEFAYAWSQPPGPPGPPLRARLIGVVRGLFIHSDEEDERATGEPARRP